MIFKEKPKKENSEKSQETLYQMIKRLTKEFNESKERKGKG